MLFNSGQLDTWSVAPGKGVIIGSARNSANVIISGATISTSPSYAVTYTDPAGNLGGTATSSFGRFYIFNATAGDTVAITGSAIGYSFTTNYATAYADSITFDGTNGTALSTDRPQLKQPSMQ
jgi:hypothetical protein